MILEQKVMLGEKTDSQPAGERFVEKRLNEVVCLSFVAVENLENVVVAGGEALI